MGGGCGLACASSWRSVAAESSCSCTTSLLRTALARAAKRSVLCVSSQQVEAGLSVQTTVHSAEPPREFCSG